jgi:uncharacterized repeat protein (TIGR03843 family)
MTPEGAVSLLAHGDIEVVGKIPESSNQALLVEVRDGDDVVLACYKCEVGERRLWDYPSGLWRREVAAYELDLALGTQLVPPTIARDDGPYGPGSLQLWVEDNGEDHYFTLREHVEFHPYLQDLCAFDVVANNADRKSGHVIFDGTRCWAIDNGLCFAAADKLRTVIWDFACCNLTESLQQRLVEFADGAVGELDRWISPDELAHACRRASELAIAGTLPEPDGDREWPPYPWPLV